MRRVLAHIHLFKNAGTSVEQGLRQQYGGRWVSYDKPAADARITAEELVGFLADKPEVVAVSSHQLRPPFEDTPSVGFDPLVFVRHPIDRIRSAYEFERVQDVDTPSATAAARLDFADWIEFNHERKSIQCANFQVLGLTALRRPNGAPNRRGHRLDEHLESAIAFLGTLPVTGTVEQYERSCSLISERYALSYPDFELRPAHVNSTSGGEGDLADRLDATKRRLGAAAYAELVAANEADLELWRRATEALG